MNFTLVEKDGYTIVQAPGMLLPTYWGSVLGTLADQTDLQAALNAIPALVPTAVKTTSYTASVSDFIPVSTNSGAVTITLPTAPSDRSIVAVKHVIQGSTNAVTISAGGSDVFNKTGGGTSLTLTLLNQGVLLQYKASGAIWYVTADNLSLASLDSRFATAAQGTKADNAGAVNGLLKSNGSATFAAAIGGNDYMRPSESALTNIAWRHTGNQAASPYSMSFKSADILLGGISPTDPSDSWTHNFTGIRILDAGGLDLYAHAGNAINLVTDHSSLLLDGAGNIVLTSAGPFTNIQLVNGDGNGLTVDNAGGVSVSSGITGDGSGLTSLDGSNISSGTVAFARLPTGTSSSTVAIGNHAHAGVYQPVDSDLTSWAAITRASGFDTFTATPSLANLKALITDETAVGWNLLTLANPSGVAFLQFTDNTVSVQTVSAHRTALSLVPGTDIVAFNGALGTPTSGTLTNCTGLPIAGITGLGSNIATFLAATKPTTIAGYGITDFNSLGDVRWQALDADLTSWAAITRASGFDTFTATPTMANLKALITDETTAGWNLLTTANPSAITFLRINADNSVSTLDAASFRTAIGAGAGGGDALVANPLSQFAATTSAQLAGVLNDESGTSGGFVRSAGGALTALTGLAIRSTGAAFDLTFATSEVLTAGRTLSFVLGDAARTLTFTGSASISGTNTGDQTTVSGNAGTATALATGRTLSITGDLTWTSPSFDGSGNVTAAGTLATVASAGTTGSSTAIPVITINAKGLTTSITTAAVVAPAATLSGTTLASGVTASSLTSFGGSPTLSTPVFTGLPTGTGVAAAATASTLVARDANVNITANNWLGGYATTTTAAGTTTLTVGSAYTQFFTGSTTQTVTLPVASTLTLGHQFVIVNNSTGAVTVNSSGANAVLILAGGTSAVITCILASGTSAASWNASYSAVSVATGKKFTVSNTLTFTGTDSSSVAFGTGGTVLYSGGALGTPSSGTLTSATGLPISTGVSGLGTGVATALAVNVGSAGAFVTFNGALGTPSSGTLTNCTFPTLNQNTSGSAASLSISGQTGLLTFTGLASTGRIKTVRDAADTILELGGSYTPSGTWTSLTMVTPVLGTPTSGTLTNCTLPVGGISGLGTGVATFLATPSGANLASALTSALPVSKGGTGATTLTAHGVVVGNGTSAVAITGAGTAGQVLTSNGASADPTFQAAATAKSILPIPANPSGGGAGGYQIRGTFSGYVSPILGVAPSFDLGTLETDAEFVIPFGCTLRNLNVRTGDTPETGSPVTTFVVRKNGVNTALTLTLTETVNTTSTDSTHSVSFAAGDRLTIFIENAGAGPTYSTGIVSISMEVDSP